MDRFSDRFSEFVARLVVFLFCWLAMPINLLRGLGSRPVHLEGFEADGTYMARGRLYLVIVPEDPTSDGTFHADIYRARAYQLLIKPRRPGRPLITLRHPQLTPGETVIRNAIQDLADH